MKNREYRVITDHVEIRLVYQELEAGEMQSLQITALGGLAGPTLAEPYLLIGPPGGALARVDQNDAQVLFVLLQRLNSGCGMHAIRARFAPAEM